MQKLQKMTAFRTKDLFFVEITTKLAENGDLLNWRPFFWVLPQREDIPPKFSLIPKKFRSGYVPGLKAALL